TRRRAFFSSAWARVVLSSSVMGFFFIGFSVCLRIPATIGRTAAVVEHPVDHGAIGLHFAGRPVMDVVEAGIEGDRHAAIGVDADENALALVLDLTEDRTSMDRCAVDDYVVESDRQAGVLAGDLDERKPIAVVFQRHGNLELWSPQHHAVSSS